MSIRPVSVREFVDRINTPPLEALPLVHTTKVKSFFDICGDMTLRPTRCDTYIGEHLLYCFVGRPAYKWDTPIEAKLWQLPIVFVFDRPDGLTFKRALPFDSGSYATRLPDYLKEFPLERFEIDSSPQSVSRMVSTFFHDNGRYLRGKAIGREEFERVHTLLPRHQEIMALIDLYNERSPDFDDRGRVIELQADQSIVLRRHQLLGVVLPVELRREPEAMSNVRRLGATVRYYEMYPIRVQSYASEIYKAVQSILKKQKRIA